MELQKSDILFLDATVVDGSGSKPRYKASIIIRGAYIKSIQVGETSISEADIVDLKEAGCHVVNCENGKWAICPGFIDMHAHSDLSLLHTPTHEAKITQGCTTEVVGQDGISYSPVNDTTMARIRKQIAGWNGNPTEPADFFDRWRSVKEYLDVLDKEKTATNVAYLVPQGNLRMLVKGYSSEPCTKDEIEAMKSILARSLHEGAVGMSSGLTYVPGCFADDEELAELCEVVKEHGGYYCPHHRSYGKGALQAYREMIELARKTGVRLHLTHATMNYPENEGRASELLTMIDDAIADGVEISLDTYPYLPGSTTLASTLPSWAASADDPKAVLEHPDFLAKIKHQALVEGTDGCHGCTLGWDILEIGGVSDASLASKYVGKTLAQIAEEQNKDPFDTYVDILKEDDFNSTILSHSGHEGNVRKIMRHSRHTGGSDGILTSTKPHPRGWGTFPRYIGHYGRDLAQGRSRNIYNPDRSDDIEEIEPEPIFGGGLEEAVAHLTSRPAGIIGVRDRGLVKEGYRADLVVFDPDEIRDVATYSNPKQPACGIRAVLVNGQFAVDEGKATGSRNGRTIRSKHVDGQTVVE
jgi:N-acyl-D-amino-acid deacylase